MPNEKCGGRDKPTGSGHTPYGYWTCVNEQWEWVPEAGIVAPPEEETE